MAEDDDPRHTSGARHRNEITGTSEFDALEIALAAPPLGTFKMDDGMDACHSLIQGFVIQDIAKHDIRHEFSVLCIPGQAAGSRLWNEAADG